MVLLGFNMMVDNDKKHFFDDRPKGLAQKNFLPFIRSDV